MGSINYSQAIRPDTAYLKKIIESSLLADWAIRIEYQSSHSETSRWQLWGHTYFAVHSASPILDALLACFKKYPENAIRLHAEKFQPHTLLIYTVYNPQYLPAKIKPITRNYPASTPQEHRQTSDLIRLTDG